MNPIHLQAVSGLLIAVATSGCGTLPIPLSSGPRATLPPALAQYYDYTPLKLTASVRSTEAGDDFQLQRLTLTAKATASMRPIQLDWYQPLEPGRHPIILMSPILAGNDLYIREFARFFAGRRLHAVLVYRPKEIFTGDRALEDIELHFQESILQLRQTLDWLSQQPQVDPQQIGSFAISMGAILTTVLAAVEPRLQASVLTLAAGEIPQIIMASTEKGVRKRRNNYLRENNLTESQALEKLQAMFRSEPMRYAPAIDPNRVLLVSGLFDRVLGLKRSWRLWRALGRPRWVILPTGHFSSVLATPGIKLLAYSFLRRKLRQAAQPPR